MNRLDRLPMPDVDGPKRIAGEITAALRSAPCVLAIALFGSLAEGRADAWSDVDMLVACENVEATKWSVAAALRRSKEVLFYRPFTSAQQPSGRYWFVGESPFHKIDISFDSMEDYEALLQGGGRLGHNIIAHEVFRRSCPSLPSVEVVPARPQVISDWEKEIGNYIYQSLRSLKRCFRGEDDTRGFEELQAAADQLSRDAVMAGGMIGELVHSVAGMAGNLLDCCSPTGERAQCSSPTGGD